MAKEGFVKENRNHSHQSSKSLQKVKINSDDIEFWFKHYCIQREHLQSPKKLTGEALSLLRSDCKSLEVKILRACKKDPELVKIILNILPQDMYPRISEEAKKVASVGRMNVQDILCADLCFESTPEARLNRAKKDGYERKITQALSFQLEIFSYVIDIYFDKRKNKIIIFHHVDGIDFLTLSPEKYEKMILELAEKAPAISLKLNTLFHPFSFEKYHVLHTGMKLGAGMAEIMSWKLNHEYVTFDSPGTYNVITALSANCKKSAISNGITFLTSLSWCNTRYRPFGPVCLLDAPKAQLGYWVKTLPLQKHPFLFVLDHDETGLTFHTSQTLPVQCVCNEQLRDNPRDEVKAFCIKQTSEGPILIVSGVNFLLDSGEQKRSQIMKILTEHTIRAGIKFFNCIFSGIELQNCLRFEKGRGLDKVIVEDHLSNVTDDILEKLNNTQKRMVAILQFENTPLVNFSINKLNELLKARRLRRCVFSEASLPRKLISHASVFSSGTMYELVPATKAKIGVTVLEEKVRIYREAREHSGKIIREECIFKERISETDVSIVKQRITFDKAGRYYKRKKMDCVFSLSQEQARQFIEFIGNRVNFSDIKKLTRDAVKFAKLGHKHISKIESLFDFINKNVPMFSPRKIINNNNKSEYSAVSIKNKNIHSSSSSLSSSPCCPAIGDTFSKPHSSMKKRSSPMQAPERSTLPIGREKLQSLRKIFEGALKRQIEAETNYLWDVEQNRSGLRDDFSSKLLNVITFVAQTAVKAAAPTVPVALPAVLAASSGATALNTYRRKRAVAKIAQELDKSDFALLQACVGQMAADAWLSFEPVIATRFSENPENEVLVLAKTLGRRVINYLKHETKEGVLPQTDDLTSCLFKGIRSGNSGGGHETWLSKRIEGRNGKKFTVEEICRDSAIREYDAMRVHAGEDVAMSKLCGVGKIKLKKDGTPKSWIYMPVAAVTMLCEQEKKEPIPCKNVENQNYYPSIYLACAADVDDYERVFEQGNAITFLEFIRNKVIPQWGSCISEVWVHDAELKGKKLTGNYSEVDFSGTDFSHTIFDGAKFKKAKMVFTNLTSVTCKNKTNLDGCDLRYANVTRTKMEKGTSRLHVSWIGANIENMEKLPDPEFAAIREEMKRQEALQHDRQTIIYNYVDALNQKLLEKNRRLNDRIIILEGLVRLLPQETADFVRQQIKALADADEELRANIDVLEKVLLHQHDEELREELNILRKSYKNLEEAFEQMESKAREIATSGVSSIAARNCTIPEGANPAFYARAALVMVNGNIPVTMEKFIMDLIERNKGLPITAIGLDHVVLPRGYKERVQAEAALLLVNNDTKEVPQALKNAMQDARSHYQKGKLAFKKGNFESASNFFQQARDSYRTEVLRYVGFNVPQNIQDEANRRLKKMKDPDGKYSTATKLGR